MSDTVDTAALRADCANCFALCCVAPAFAKSADFAIDKPAGRACPNLRADHRCGIHTGLRGRGFTGCTVYDCFGAGQKVAQVTFAGRDWRESPVTAKSMFAVFPIMRHLHELLWYLAEARARQRGGPVERDLLAAFDRIERLTFGDHDTLLAVDVAAIREQVNPLLLRTSELARAGIRRAKDHRGADLIGAKLRKADLTGASLRGACLIGADLREANLRLADVIGADLRDTDLRGADLTEAIFLIQSQLDAARGDVHTRLPASMTRPAHWHDQSTER